MNTRSSTETEVVGVDDCLPQVLWTKIFLDAQDYMAEHKVHQDNKSSRLLEINGKVSSGKRTNHMNVRYFFVKDRVDCGAICIEYCGTLDIVGDFFTRDGYSNNLEIL